LKKIVDVIKSEFPRVRIAGYRSLPFYDANHFREGTLLPDVLNDINALGPDLIWVGLSSPKQDFLMRSHVKHLRRGIMLGVGGVFDYLSGDVKKSPEWIKKIGLRWLWRLIKEPKRLGAKYGMTIKVFVKILLNKVFS
jgi:N-acetylglucosaminyldiphosphoundecaprenol N-acetyl-beta-D-mannosaminyltransferase